MKRVLSGVRPTGDVQLGNYLGAIRNWVKLQDQMDENFFCIVDLHALTTIQDTHLLKENSYIMAATYLACGIDQSKSTIFCQSHVSAHCELSWIFSCFTPLGWLNRMTQFKDKAGKNQEKACLGLFAYPVLMAADILAYKATHVPVGEDQKQHLELARDIAGAFNHHYNTNYFPLPEPMIIGEGVRVMSLRDGTTKMSKSDPSDYSRIELLDEDDEIVAKIKKAKTDADLLPGDPKDLEGRPEAKNLLTIYGAMQDKSLESVCQEMAGKNFAFFKKELADVLIHGLSPMRTKLKDYLNARDHLDTILKSGAEKAKTVTQAHLKEINEIVGLLVY